LAGGVLLKIVCLLMRTLVQSIRRGHYQLATDVPARHRLRVAFDQLTTAIWNG
jgi:hypothetical protein